MKPPYLNKLSKKQLKKAYSDQWKQNNKIVAENYNLNRDNERLQTIVHDQEQEIHVKATLLTEHFWKIEELKKEVHDLRFWKIKEDAIDAMNFFLKTQILKDPKDIEIENLKQLLAHEQKKRTEAELLNVDLEEALSRSRQLRKSLQEVADRKTWEKAKIEDMAENLYDAIQEDCTEVVKEQLWMRWFTFMCEERSYNSLTEEEKDIFRVKATHIISHQPTDGKPEGTTLDEGSAG